MDKEFFMMNSSIVPQLQFDHPFSPTMQTWQSLDCFLPTQPSVDHFDSALSSMVSSPTSNSALSTDNFMMRELIGKLGNISNSIDIPNYINGGNCSSNDSCYNTPLSSPPKLGKSMPNIDHMVNENSPCLGNSIGLSSNLPAMPGDPGFAERAARFSSFGSRSFNGRTTTNQFELNNANKNGDFVHRSCSNLGGGNGKLQRVLSSPSLKVEARSQVDNNFNNNSMNEGKQSGSSVNDQNAEFSKSVENSSISDSRNQAKENGTSRKRKAASSKGKAEETGSHSQTPTNSNKVVENGNDSNAKRKKLEGCNFVESGHTKEDENKGGGDDGKKEEQKPVEPPKDYIHVRARRGQATDSHSLAERVRREKIGERMKLLQDLVPGCNKVTGKALMLEEIINYVQSLQKQVEFLSMKLSNVDARLEMNMSNQLSKDGIQQNGCLPYPMYPPIVPTQYGQPQQNPLHVSTTTTGAMDPLTPTLNHNNHAYHLSPFDGFFNCLSQLPSLCEGELQSIVEMGFGQKEKGYEAQSLHGTNPTQMKIEF